MASSVLFPLHIKYTCRPDVTKTVLNLHSYVYVLASDLIQVREVVCKCASAT
jgi:hypothetical protein